MLSNIKTNEYFFIYYINNPLIGLVGRVFANDPGDLGLIPGHVDFKNDTWYFLA